MSAFRADFILDANGGNTCTVNGITPELATLSQALSLSGPQLITPPVVREVIRQKAASVTTLLLDQALPTGASTATFAGLPSFSNFGTLLVHLDGATSDTAARWTCTTHQFMYFGVTATLITAFSVVGNMVNDGQRTAYTIGGSTNGVFGTVGAASPTTSFSVSVSAGTITGGSLSLWSIR
jgi:hypothetical protein